MRWGLARTAPAPAFVAALLLALTASGSPPPDPSADPPRPSAADVVDYVATEAGRAGRVRDALIELDVNEAKRLLEGADLTDPGVALERARYDLYSGDYDAAAAMFSRPDLAIPRAAELMSVSLGCARAMAAAVVVTDEARGVVVRLQDDDDRAFVPLLADVAVKVQAMLIKELGVELPKPLRVDLVRDQFTLAAMTGLPEEAARTTGTVAVAKWGRVTMISPRATPHGYPWLDTLAHEMTHLALTRGTKDKAPLWLQEGVAKREETRWREPQPFDDVPGVDAVAAVGIEKGLGRSLDKLGPSIAMLPTPEQASVAFAEVSSFIRFWANEVGPDALPQLVLRLRASFPPDGVNTAIQEVSGVDFAGWDKRWRAHLASVPHELPAELAPGGSMPHVHELVKLVRLGELLDRRGHHQAAVVELSRAQMLLGTDATIRCGLAAAMLSEGDRDGARPLVEKVEEVHGAYARWWSLHGLLFPEPAADADRAFGFGITLSPLEPAVACEEKAAPALPADPLRAAICETARRAPAEQRRPVAE